MAASLIDRIRSLPAAAPLLSRLRDGRPIFVVGGAVRDLLLGGAPLDLDLVVEGDALELARELGGEVRAHSRFGTCTVRLDGREYDIARARRERYARPGALPDVEPAPIEEDLRRRDFTVNALAVGLTGPRTGELVAVPEALQDLDRRRLAVLHEHSFVDDPTRLLRLVRYAARLGFEPAPATERLAARAVREGALQSVTGARLGAEFRLLAREPEAVQALRWLHRLGIDGAIAERFGLADAALAQRALGLLEPGDRRDRLVMALAGLEMEPRTLRRLLEQLGFKAEDRESVVVAVAGARPLAERLARARRPSEIVAAAERASPELVALAGALGPQPAARRWLQGLRHLKLEIAGGDLIEAGVPRGPAIGAGLRAALAAKADGLAGDRAAELRVALGAAAGNAPEGD